MENYLSELEKSYPDVAVRYHEKIKCIGIDPFAVPDSELLHATSDLPSITNMDIVSYLVLTHSFYTGDQLKAYKSLTAFKYFEAGHVGHLGIIRYENEQPRCILAKVKHSQRSRLAPLRTWVICNPDGSIVTAHCTCMAGIGEVCSHVAAVLFAVEYIHNQKNVMSCTELKSTWPVPRTKDTVFSKVDDMVFARPNPKSKNIDVPSLTVSDITKLIHDIKECGSKCVIEKVVEPFASSLPEAKRLELVPSVFASIYNKDFEEFSLDELQQLAQQIIVIIKEEDCQTIKENTKMQSFCNDWFEQRKGRITASIFKSVCVTNCKKPSMSLLKKICYPIHNETLKTKEMQWGVKNEMRALQKLKLEMDKQHQNVSLERVGLCLDPEYPCFAASPDSMVKCDCCGSSCVEVKCPFTLKSRSSTIEQYINKKDSCLKKADNGSLFMNSSHMYYYQVQMQMAIIKTTSCFFGIWAPHQFYLIQVKFNSTFWTEKSKLALLFHQKVVLPELMAKFYTRVHTT